MTNPTKTEDTIKVTFRIPIALYQRIRSASEYSGRPINSEVITWLEYRDLAAAMDDLKRQNEELRRLVIDTLDAVCVRQK